MNELENDLANETTQTCDSHVENVATLRGVPGESVANVALLDLRGASAEELQRLKALENVATVLVDTGQRAGLSHVRMKNVALVVEAEADERVLIGPVTEFDQETLDAMADNVRLTVVGITVFAPDVSPALVAQKFARLRVVGPLLSSAGVRGALLDRMELIGPAATLKSGSGPIVKSIGELTISPLYLEHIDAGAVFVNIGHVKIAPEVALDLFKTKIGDYHNIGLTEGPEPVIAYLQSHAGTNLGAFQTK